MLILLKTKPQKGTGTVPAADAAKARREGKRYSRTHF